MLISMPTGTSTIFGVFQAILALLVVRTNFALANKVVGNEKFASEIFFHKPGRFHAALQKEVTELCGPPSKQRRINGFRVIRSRRVPFPVRRHRESFG
jgi:hypothetical protein